MCETKKLKTGLHKAAHNKNKTPTRCCNASKQLTTAEEFAAKWRSEASLQTPALGNAISPHFTAFVNTILHEV